MKNNGLKKQPSKNSIGLFSLSGGLPGDLRNLMALILLFSAVQIQYLGFSTAYVAGVGGASWAFLYAGAVFGMSFLGYWSGVVAMSRRKAPGGRLIREGMIRTGLASLLGAAVGDERFAPFLLALGGVGGGYAWAERQALELGHRQAAALEQYFAELQSWIALLRIAIPALVVALAWLWGESQTFLVAIGFLSFLFALLAPSVGSPSVAPKPLWREIRALKTTEPRWARWYYMAEGGGNSIRNALFAVGAMAALGGLAGYGLAEAGLGALSGATLYWISRRQGSRGFGRLARLRAGSALTWLAWAALLGSLWDFRLFWLFAAALALG